MTGQIDEENRDDGAPNEDLVAQGDQSSADTISLEQLRQSQKTRAATIFLFSMFGLALAMLLLAPIEYWLDDWIITQDFFIPRIGSCLVQTFVLLDLTKEVIAGILGIASWAALSISEDLKRVKVWTVIIYGSMIGIVLSLHLGLQIKADNDIAAYEFEQVVSNAQCIVSGPSAAVIAQAGPALADGLLWWFLSFLLAFGLAGPAIAAAKKIGVRKIFSGTDAIDG